MCSLPRPRLLPGLAFFMAPIGGGRGEERTQRGQDPNLHRLLPPPALGFLLPEWGRGGAPDPSLILVHCSYCYSSETEERTKFRWIMVCHRHAPSRVELVCYEVPGGSENYQWNKGREVTTVMGREEAKGEHVPTRKAAKNVLFNV